MQRKSHGWFAYWKFEATSKSDSVNGEWCAGHLTMFFYAPEQLRCGRFFRATENRQHGRAHEIFKKFRYDGCLGERVSGWPAYGCTICEEAREYRAQKYVYQSKSNGPSQCSILRKLCEITKPHRVSPFSIQLGNFPVNDEDIPIILLSFRYVLQFYSKVRASGTAVYGMRTITNDDKF